MKLCQANLEPYLARQTDVQLALGWLLCAHRSPVLFDVGACEGEDSIRYARSFPRSRVFSFEPLPANQAQVRANFSKYQVANVELIPFALADRSGSATFHVSAGEPAEKFAGEAWNYGNKSSSLLAPADPAAPMHGWITFPETAIVDCDTLDEFCASRRIDRIDFIHMDVQGAEHLVLAGAARMLPAITAIWLEVAECEIYKGQKLRSEIEAFLRSHGFKLVFGRTHGIEGDQFYVNRRSPRILLVLAWREFHRARAKLRALAVAAARSLGLYDWLRGLRRKHVE